MPKPPPSPQTGAPKTGTHTHQCSKNNHNYTCNFTVACNMEMMPAPQTIIDAHCQFCMALETRNYGR
jgi:hypothetical protein